MSHEPISPDAPEWQREMHALRVEVRDLNAQVRGLVEAWETAQGIVKFMKFLGTMATAGAAIWALIGVARSAK
jgi:hypothetical protein